MKEDREIKNCNVCVIGGAGFIGSHLVDYLIDERGCNVTVLDNLITGKTKNIHEKAKFIWADIRDEESELVRIFEKEKVEYTLRSIRSILQSLNSSDQLKKIKIKL